MPVAIVAARSRLCACFSCVFPIIGHPNNGHLTHGLQVHSGFWNSADSIIITRQHEHNANKDTQENKRRRAHDSVAQKAASPTSSSADAFFAGSFCCGIVVFFLFCSNRAAARSSISDRSNNIKHKELAAVFSRRSLLF